LASMREMHWRLSRKSTCCQSMPWWKKKRSKP
jgi:hypothetical protein